MFGGAREKDVGGVPFKMPAGPARDTPEPAAEPAPRERERYNEIFMIMSSRLKRHRVRATLKTGLAVLALTASFALAPPAHAITAAEVNGLRSLEDARALFKIDGNDAPKFAWQPEPPPKNPTDAKGRNVAVFVCEQTVASCSPGTPGAVRFRLTDIHHEDRGAGLDNWDFVFKPYRGDTPIRTQLQVVYRVNTDGAKVAALVWGDPGDDSLPASVVGQLNSFSSTSFAEDFLHKLQNDAGLKWAEQNGIGASTNQTSLADRASSDPFSLALKKLAEIITSLIGSVTSAVAWAIDAGTLMNNDGLARAWTVVRDLVNVLFILVLLALAFMSIVRIEPQKYNVRQLLPLLVFSVIAVNFSFLFAGILANTAAVLSQPFLEQAQGFIQEAAGVGAGYSDGLVDGFGEAVVLLIASIIILIALIILLFFLVARIIVLWVLAVLSPVLFLFLVLPLTRGESKNLLTTYIQWVYLAPIAMLLLFTGSLMLNSALRGTDTGDPGGSAILQALFFAGIVVAAVMVPVAIGGRIAQVLSKQGSKYGRVGGKGGLGAAGMIPLGKGMTVGEAARTGRGFFKLKKDAQEQRGLERAAGIQTGIHDALGDSGIARALTGRDETQARTVTEALVDDQLKKLNAIGFQDADARASVQYAMADDAGKQRLARTMTPEQLANARSHIGRLASAKMLAGGGWWNEDIARHFGHTGYQKLAEGDPAMQNLKRQRYGAGHQFTANDFNRMDLGIAMSNMGGDKMRDLYSYVWDYADRPQGDAFGDTWRAVLSDQGLVGEDGTARRINLNAMRQNMNARHRNHAPNLKRERMAANWQHYGTGARNAIISGDLDSREDRFIPIATGPQTFQDALAQAPPDYKRDP